MKLYFCPGACSLAPHIVSREAGIELDLEQVDIRENKTKSGADFWAINAKGQVPVLELDRRPEPDRGADHLPVSRRSEAGRGPCRAGRFARALSRAGMAQFRRRRIAQDLRADVPADHARGIQDAVAGGDRPNGWTWIEKQLAGKQYLMGDNFTVADAYLFTVLRWSPRVGVDLADGPTSRPMWIASPRVRKCRKRSRRRAWRKSAALQVLLPPGFAAANFCRQ